MNPNIFTGAAVLVGACIVFAGGLVSARRDADTLGAWVSAILGLIAFALLRRGFAEERGRRGP